jgi:hypothetical protein
VRGQHPEDDGPVCYDGAENLNSQISSFFSSFAALFGFSEKKDGRRLTLVKL